MIFSAVFVFIYKSILFFLFYHSLFIFEKISFFYFAASYHTLFLFCFILWYVVIPFISFIRFFFYSIITFSYLFIILLFCFNMNFSDLALLFYLYIHFLYFSSPFHLFFKHVILFFFCFTIQIALLLITIFSVSSLFPCLTLLPYYFSVSPSRFLIFICLLFPIFFVVYLPYYIRYHQKNFLDS